MVRRLLLIGTVYFLLTWALGTAWPPRHVPAWGMALVAASGYLFGWWARR